MASLDKMDYWRLLSFKWNEPCINMAIDEAILRGYIAGAAPPTLRIYGWKPEGISLGYFQDAHQVLDIARCAERNIPFVRRTTGGEAIFHGDDVSYSIVCSRRDLAFPRPVKEGFKRLCSFLINAYRKLGLEASFFCENKGGFTKKRNSGFCLAANQAFDIAIEGKKIGGNAQKRIKDIIFQHGSIPLRLDIKRITSLLREELNGMENKIVSLEKALERNIDFNKFASMLASSFKEVFGVRLVEENLTPFELESAKQLKEEKYGSKQWNYKYS